MLSIKKYKSRIIGWILKKKPIIMNAKIFTISDLFDLRLFNVSFCKCWRINVRIIKFGLTANIYLLIVVKKL